MPFLSCKSEDSSEEEEEEDPPTKNYGLRQHRRIVQRYEAPLQGEKQIINLISVTISNTGQPQPNPI